MPLLGQRKWKCLNPEARARAEQTAAKLEAQIQDLKTEATKGDAPRFG